MASTKVIIDTDAGLDDALAIFMALEAHRRGCLEVLAITTVFGNTSVHNVNNNVLRILRLANLLEVPVYSGASQSLVHPWKQSEKPYHGQDGFGDADLPPQPPAATLLQPRHAVWALLDLVKQHSGEVVVVGLGPLTNLALAKRLDPAFFSHLAGLYIMGGNSLGVGNITASAEFNFHSDAEAAFVIMEESSIPIRLTPWEICSRYSFPESMRAELGETKTNAADLMNKIEANCRMNEKHWVTCDQLAMAWVIDDAKHKRLEARCRKENGQGSGGILECHDEPLVTATKTFYASVETSGSMTKGLMVIDHYNLFKRQTNVILMEDINFSLYTKYISMGFGADV